MIDSSDFGPHYEPDLFAIPFRLGRLCKGGGSDAAIKEQRLAREQSAKQFAEQMGLMRQQQEAASKIRTPQYLPSAPAPSGGMDSYQAGRDAMRVARRRFGSAATVLSPSYRPALGGAVPLAA
jgi:hypothetical protein